MIPSETGFNSRHNHKLGRQGELILEKYYTDKGYKLIVRNYQCYLNGRQGRSAEVDLILQYERLLVFVEVKTRTNASFGLSIEQITAKKIRSLALAYHLFVQKQPEFRSYNFRIDIACIDKGKIVVLENAVDYTNLN